MLLLFFSFNEFELFYVCLLDCLVALNVGLFCGYCGCC